MNYLPEILGVNRTELDGHRVSWTSSRCPKRIRQDSSTRDSCC